MTHPSGRELEELATFVAVVEANGYTAAARKLNVRKATLSERIQSLEKRLDVSLLARTTRALRLTSEGNAYLEHARRALAAARDAEAAVAVAKARPMGVLRVTTAPGLDELLLANVVLPYLVQHPDVAVVIDGSVHRVDLVRDGFDLAIRTGTLDDSSLVSRQLYVVQSGYFASPSYLARAGTPRQPEDLSRHATISVFGGPQLDGWRSLAGDKPRLVVRTHEKAAEAAAAGIGIVQTPCYVAQPFLARKQLVEILRDWPVPPIDVHAVFPPGGTLVPRTRLFVDAVARWFGADNDEICAK